MDFTDPTIPNLTDFTAFVSEQVPSGDVPVDGSVQWALNYSTAVVLFLPEVPSILYVLACYNLGLHHLLGFATDQAGQTFFADARAKYGLLSFTAGPPLSASDNGTSESRAGSDGVRDLTLLAMDCIKTPWGQRYLQYAQSFGPSPFGLT